MRAVGADLAGAVAAIAWASKLTRATPPAWTMTRLLSLTTWPSTSAAAATAPAAAATATTAAAAATASVATPVTAPVTTTTAVAAPVTTPAGGRRARGQHGRQYYAVHFSDPPKVKKKAAPVALPT